MINKIKFYVKLGLKMLKREVVNNDDYREEYNKIAQTYKNWVGVMGRFTDNIIKPEYLSSDKELKILDFACGTGYITKNLLRKEIPCKITAVDYSEKMLQTWKDFQNSKVQVIHADGIEFLKNTDEKFDIIFFGWALSYFNHEELFKLFEKVLKDKGIVAVITNVKGTLFGIEELFLKVMSQSQEVVMKPMDIKFNLPKGKDGLIKWFKKYNFENLEICEDEVTFSFNTPEELLQWLNKTGAVAGTAKIFNDYSLVKDKIIKEIRKQKYKDGKYEINHKFAYGIFRKL